MLNNCNLFYFLSYLLKNLESDYGNNKYVCKCSTTQNKQDWKYYIAIK